MARGKKSKAKASGRATQHRKGPGKRDRGTKKKAPAKSPKRRRRSADWQPVRKKESQADAALRIDAALSVWSDRLLSELGQEVTTRLRVHENRDGTVDGEMVVSELPRGLSAKDVLDAASETQVPIAYGWLTTGIRFADEAREHDHYRRHRGMVEAFAHAQRATQAKIDINIATATDRILRGMSKKFRGTKPRQIVFRVHWNPENRRPKR